MISSINYTSRRREIGSMERDLRDAAALLSDEEWNWLFAADYSEITESADRFPALDLSCFDLTGPDGLRQAEELRRRYPEMYLLVIADENISPKKYVNPRIYAAELMIRPFTEAEMREGLQEFVRNFLQLRRKAVNDNVYVVETREGRTFLPTDKILYFEASQKKIHICAGSRDYECYDTLENIARDLPESFLRVHRGYIVNTDQIEKIGPGGNELVLKDGAQIPVSRKYHGAVREFANSHRQERNI